MIVMKFGGSSLKDARSIIKVAEIIKSKIFLQPVIVASALGKTTRNLLNCCLAVVNQNHTEKIKILRNIKEYHIKTSKKLGLYQVGKEFHHTINGHFSSIESNLEKIQSEKRLNPKLQDSTLAYGELLSTLILASYLESIRVDVQLMDVRKCIITDEHFTHATPKESESFDKIRKYVRPVLKENRIPILQGFIGTTTSGKTTTLGFEGSDYSAVLIGAALQVDEVQIWKDVPGVMSADPAIIKTAIPIEQMTFDEAAELSRCGAKVLHPSTIRPACNTNIPVKILNSKQPDFQGTIIRKNIESKSNSVKSITARRDLTIINITAKQSQSEFDFAAQVFVTLRNLEMSPTIIEGSDRKVILIIKNAELREAFFDQIDKWADVDVIKSKATISIIGNLIRNQHSVIEKIHKYDGIESIQFDIDKTCEHSYTILLNESDLDKTIRQLHYDFFEVRN